MRSELFLSKLPISVNAAYAQADHTNVHGRRTSRRIKSQEYASWIIDAGFELRPQVKHMHAGPVDVVYLFGRDNGKQDVGNFEKVLTDLLVKVGAIKDDNRVECMAKAWCEGVGVRIFIQDCEHRPHIVFGGVCVTVDFDISKAGKRFDTLARRAGA